jgi:alkylhydroperoxidase family enzyme
VTKKTAKSKSATKTVTTYKALDKDFRCKDFQFKVGETYTHDGPVVICESGFHGCENPLDVLSYYDLCASRFAVVEQAGELKRNDEDSKIASATITIKAELKLGEFTKQAVQWIIDRCKAGKNVKAASGNSAKLAASGDYAQLAASGDYAQLAASGYSAQLAASGNSAKLAASGNYAQLAASGNYAKLAASGDYAQLAASGDYAQLAASGNSAKLAASGYYAKLAASGNSAQLAASGNYAKLAASGNYAQLAASGNSAKLAASGYSAQLAASGKDSVIASSSYAATAKGVIGTWIALAEYDKDGKCVGFATGCIGKGGLEPNVDYRSSGGKLVKV